MEQARRGVLLSIVAEVVTGYIDLLALDEQLKIAQSTSDTYAEALRIAQLQFEYGATSQMTVAQAASQYETAQSKIPPIRHSIAAAENALNILMGRNPGPVMRGLPLDKLREPAVPADLPSNLLLRRPDILGAEQDLIAANAMIGAARAQYFPTISLTGAFGASSESLKNLRDGGAKTWNFAGVINLPLFQGGAIRSQVMQAEATQRAALAKYESVVQSAFADVDNALSLLQESKRQMAHEIRLVGQLDDYARLARLQYREGYSAYSVVLQAEQSLFPEQLALAQLKATSLTSLAGLYKALGRRLDRSCRRAGWGRTNESLKTMPYAESGRAKPENPFCFKIKHGFSASGWNFLSVTLPRESVSHVSDCLCLACQARYSPDRSVQPGRVLCQTRLAGSPLAGSSPDLRRT